jgi:hypothetical protein
VSVCTKKLLARTTQVHGKDAAFPENKAQFSRLLAWIAIADAFLDGYHHGIHFQQLSLEMSVVNNAMRISDSL